MPLKRLSGTKPVDLTDDVIHRSFPHLVPLIQQLDEQSKNDCWGDCGSMAGGWLSISSEDKWHAENITVNGMGRKDYLLKWRPKDKSAPCPEATMLVDTDDVSLAVEIILAALGETKEPEQGYPEWWKMDEESWYENPEIRSDLFPPPRRWRKGLQITRECLQRSRVEQCHECFIRAMDILPLDSHGNFQPFSESVCENLQKVEDICKEEKTCWVGQCRSSAMGLLRGDSTLQVTANEIVFILQHVCVTRNDIPPTARRSVVTEIYGNPFHQITPDPAWLSWNDGAIVKMAQSIHQEQRFEYLPILADALEEAGCKAKEILNHCREPGDHVRGCWVIDLFWPCL